MPISHGSPPTEHQESPDGRGLRRMVSWSQHPRLLLAIMVQTFVTMLGAGIIAPALPLYARSFGLNAAMVGMLASAFGLARMPMNVPAGSLAERIGRRPLMVAGLLITALASFLIGLSTTFAQLLVLRLLQGVGSAIQMTAAMVVVTADISTEQDRGRTMSLYQMSMKVGGTLGPIIGGIVGERLGLQMPFFVYAGLSLGTAAWAFFAIGETRGLSAGQARSATAGQSTAAPHRSPSTRHVLSNRDLVLICLVALAGSLTAAGSQSTILPLWGSEVLEIGSARLGTAFTVIGLVNLATISLAGIICDRYGRKWAIVPSCLVRGLALATFVIGRTYAGFVGSCVLLGLGNGIGGPAPATYVSDVIAPHERGLALGVYRTMADIGNAVGPLLLGAIADLSGYGCALLTNAALLVAIGLAFTLLARETRARV